VIDAIGDPVRYEEIVFCGTGNHDQLDALKEVAAWVKSRGERRGSIPTGTAT